jgi:oxygen-independent coproporphyrinogen-3 oxidase
MERFLAGIERELALRAPAAAGVRFRSVFLGGGTPSALSSRQFRRLWSALRAHVELDASAEITIEANPESVRPSLLATWRSAGVNRLSIGAQSFVPEELAALGRIHDRERIGAAVQLARAAGFERLSIDLMFGFPGHTPERWQHSIDAALALDTGHLSAYAFIPEPGTPLGNRVLRGEAAMASDTEQAEFYAALDERATAQGLATYEVSNWSRPDQESRHNLGYWLRRPYLSFGPGAHGHWGGERYGNHYAIERWARALEAGERPEAAREPDTESEAAAEVLMLGLRLTSGLRLADYAPGVAAQFHARYAPALAEAVALGRLEPVPGGWRVRREHRLLADDVIAWIAARGTRGLTAGRSAA